MSRIVSLIGAVSLAMVGCDREESMTLLHPDGPPEVSQVFVTELVDDGEGGLAAVLNLAFGEHPDACPVEGDPPFGCSDVGDGTVGQAALDTQKIRIVFDELLDGETIEQFQCACVAGGGDEPCPAGPTASLDPSACVDNPNSTFNEQGKWLDSANDGVPDAMELLPDLVTIDCGGTLIVPGPLEGFYNPSGNQQVPVSTGLAEGIGPALVLTLTQTLPADTDCGITFPAGKITDKDGNEPFLSAPITFRTMSM